MTKRDAETLAAECVARAENLKANLSESIEIVSLSLNSKLPFKALSLREVLLHRFADQAFCAADALRTRNAISAATLTRGCMETFARTYEFSEYLTKFFDVPDLDAFDDFLMRRLFGSRDGEEALLEAVNILTTISKVDKLGINFRRNYDRMSEIVHPNYAGGLGAFQRIDHEKLVARFGDKETGEINLRMVGHIQAGNLMGFEYYYNSLEQPIRRLNESFEDGTMRHE